MVCGIREMVISIGFDISSSLVCFVAEHEDIIVGMYCIITLFNLVFFLFLFPSLTTRSLYDIWLEMDGPFLWHN